MDFDELHQEREEKIREFEEHIQNKLKVDLEKLLQIRERQYFELSTYLELRNNIELLKNNQLKEIKTMIDLGSHFYVKAKVSALLLMKRERQRTSQIFNLLNCRFDTSRIYVHVGLGFHVEFTLDEALKFIDVKEKHINIYIEELTKKINKIRAQINYMYQGIKELKQM
jgi:prefoldin subunit 5